MAQTPRLTSEEKRKLTLRELLTLEGAQKPKVAGEVKSHIKRLEEILDPKTGVAVLDIPVDQMDVGQVMGDIITDSPFKDLDVESTAYRSHSSSLITRLNTLWAGAGYGTGYVKNEIESYLTPDVFAEESGWKYLRARKTPTGFPDDTYQKLKGILADPSIPEQNRLQLGAYLFGGFRPENLGSFKIENYDRQGGTLTFYDAKSKKNKVVVLNPVAQDFMNQAIGERTNGPIFMDKDRVQNELNKILKERMGVVSFRKPDGSIKQEDFTLYKLRNLNETLLTDTGLTAGDIDFLNGRKAATEAEGYVSESARKRRIDNAAKKMIGMIVGYSGTLSVSQFSEDIGIPLSEKTKQIAVSADVLVDDNYLNALPDEFKQSLPGEFGVYTPEAIPQADPILAEQFKQEQLAQSQLRTAEAQKAAVITERDALELQNSPELQELRAKSSEGRKQISDAAQEIKPVVLPDDVKANVPAFLDFLTNMKGKGQAVVAGLSAGLGVLSLAGVATEAEAAAREEFGRSGSPLRAAGAGALRGTYEVAETPLMMGLRAQPAGGPESSPITPEQQVAEGKTLEEQMGRIRQFEAKMGPGIGGPVPPQQRGLVDDQMTRLLQGE